MVYTKSWLKSVWYPCKIYWTSNFGLMNPNDQIQWLWLSFVIFSFVGFYRSIMSGLNTNHLFWPETRTFKMSENVGLLFSLFCACYLLFCKCFLWLQTFKQGHKKEWEEFSSILIMNMFPCRIELGQINTGLNRDATILGFRIIMHIRKSF